MRQLKPAAETQPVSSSEGDGGEKRPERGPAFQAVREERETLGAAGWSRGGLPSIKVYRLADPPPTAPKCQGGGRAANV